MKHYIQEFYNYDVNEIAEKYIDGTPQISEVPVFPDTTNTTQIHGTGVEDTTITEGTITYDIRFFAILPNSKERIRLIINLEAQNDFYPGYPIIKRAIYYCSRMISSQYGTEFTNAHYEKIKKVYSIWICINPPKYRENSITKYSITEENLFGTVKEHQEHYDLITAIMICLGKPEKEQNHELLNLLDILFSTNANKQEKKTILETEFNIPMTQQIENEVNIMYNLSDGVERRGFQRGINSINTLNMLLLKANRIEDLKRAVIDEEYQAQLMKELLPQEANF